MQVQWCNSMQSFRNRCNIEHVLNFCIIPGSVQCSLALQLHWFLNIFSTKFMRKMFQHIKLVIQYKAVNEEKLGSWDVLYRSSQVLYFANCGWFLIQCEWLFRWSRHVQSWCEHMVTIWMVNWVTDIPPCSLKLGKLRTGLSCSKLRRASYPI